MAQPKAKEPKRYCTASVACDTATIPAQAKHDVCPRCRAALAKRGKVIPPRAANFTKRERRPSASRRRKEQA